MRRFAVVEESMLPTLAPGDTIVARRDGAPPPGSIVVFPHPSRAGMWLVKRATAVSAGEAWVESDNPGVTTADSRTLGWVPTSDIHRVIIRYRPPLSFTRL